MLQLRSFITLLITIGFLEGGAQNIGINEDGSSPDASAILDIKSNDKGMLVPRLTTAQRTGIATPATGLIVYDTTSSGFWFYDGSSWVQITSGSTATNTLDEAYDEGGAGAGRVIDADGGVVSVQGTDGIEVTGTFGSGATIGSPGAGTRMFFNPRKAAFRAGSVTGNDWNDANVGDYSVAMGYNSMAVGIESVAIGYGAYANAQRSIALGGYTEPTGVLGLAGPEGTVEGVNSFAMGPSLASGDYAFAFGENSTASGLGSISIGTNNVSSGNRSMAMGFMNTSSDFVSFAVGDNNIANDSWTIAMGYISQASGLAAVALGYGVTANSNRSFATGSFTIAEGRNSAAFNTNTIAHAYSSTAIGRFNIGNGNQLAWYAMDPIFEIGIGTDALNKANAFTVLKNGNTGIMNPNPDATLDVVGTFQLVDGTEGLGLVLTSDANGNATWAAPTNEGPIAFSVYLNSSTSATGGDNFYLSTSEFTSNCTFIPSMSRFLVPEDGIYSFTVHDISNATLNSIQGIEVLVNTTTVKQFSWRATTTTYESNTFTFLLNLTEGESVYFDVTGNRTLIGSFSASSPRCSVSGHLVR